MPCGEIVSGIRERLFALRDEEYAAFQAKLTPTVSADKFIGVRMPDLRKLAKELVRDKSGEELSIDKSGAGLEAFLGNLPHEYYDENLLQALVINELRPLESFAEAVDKFLPFVDNWAVCDALKPRLKAAEKPALLQMIIKWVKSDKTYTCRFGIHMLMTFFLDGDFKPEYLEIPASVVSEEYYVNMMIAWYFATALAKQWDETVVYIEERRLSDWVHRKSIQKACESYRITPEQKEYLRSLK